jgi:uncharacterized protein (DUF302 family)
MRISKLLGSLFLAFALAAPGLSFATQASPAQAPAQAIVVEDVSRADFPTTLKNLKAQLDADGWNIVAEIDLGDRLSKKGVQIPGGLVILELTSGKNAVPLLKQDETRYVSALMPCSVSVYGMSDGRVMISRMNAGMMAGMMEPKVADVMNKAASKLDQTIKSTLDKLSK